MSTSSLGLVLPEPVVLWESTRSPKSDEGQHRQVPIRLIRRWYAAIARGGSEQYADPKIIVEAAPTTDALDQPVWQRGSVIDLPPCFWSEIFPLPELLPQEVEVD